MAYQHAQKFTAPELAWSIEARGNRDSLMHFNHYSGNKPWVSGWWILPSVLVGAGLWATLLSFVF